MGTGDKANCCFWSLIPALLNNARLYLSIACGVHTWCINAGLYMCMLVQHGMLYKACTLNRDATFTWWLVVLLAEDCVSKVRTNWFYFHSLESYLTVLCLTVHSLIFCICHLFRPLHLVTWLWTPTLSMLVVVMANIFVEAKQLGAMQLLWYWMWLVVSCVRVPTRAMLSPLKPATVVDKQYPLHLYVRKTITYHIVIVDFHSLD